MCRGRSRRAWYCGGAGQERTGKVSLFLCPVANAWPYASGQGRRTGALDSTDGWADLVRQGMITLLPRWCQVYAGFVFLGMEPLRRLHRQYEGEDSGIQRWCSRASIKDETENCQPRTLASRTNVMSTVARTVTMLTVRPQAAEDFT